MQKKVSFFCIKAAESVSFDYDIEKEKMEARKLKPNVDILEVNIKDKQSLQNVIDWINFKRKMR